MQLIMRCRSVIFYLIIFLLTPIFSYTQQSFNMTLLGDWDGNTVVHSGVKYNDIWGYVDASHNEYAIVGSPNMVHFIDVTNPASPTLVQEFTPGATTVWRDFKTYKTYSYGVADQGNEGLLVFDMSALPGGAISLVNQDNSVFGRAHNIFIDVPNGLLYVAGSNTVASGLIVYDLNVNPINPPIVGNATLQGGGYVHDVYVRDNIAYCSHGGNGFYIWDYTNPASPVFIDSRVTGGYNHSSWLTDDGNTAFFAEEVPAGRPMGVLDISDVPNNGIVPVTTFKFPLLAPAEVDNTPHNPFIVGNYLIISYYEDGVQIFDISDPANPVQSAWYDTDPNNTTYNGTSKNWGVYPFFPSGNIVASDTEIGLVVLSTTLPLVTTCNDGLQNGIELGVDCGGYCAACTFPPIADFSSMTTISCDGVVSFTDFSANGPTSWAWDFGDGNTSSLQNPTHTYTNAGTYSVMLTSSNGLGSDSETKTAYITINIPASPSVTNNSFCSPGSTTLTASGSGQLNWYDGSGNLVNTGSSFTTPALTTTTTYFVEDELLTMPQNFGPVDGSIGSGAHHGSSTQFLVFTVTQSLTLVSAFVDADAAGPRTFELKDGSGAVINSSTIMVPAGQSRVTLNFNMGPGNYQIGGSGMNLFRNDSGVNYPYSITDLVSITSSTAGPNFYYYLYDWEVEADPCTSNQVPVVATAANNPISSFTPTVSGTMVSFSDNSTDATSWSWDFGDGNMSALQNPTHIYTPGVYTVTLSVTNSCGTNMSTQQITIGAAPMAAFMASSTSGCAPLSVNFTDQSTNSPSSWSWTFMGGSPGVSSMQNPAVVYNTPGTYTVVLEATNGSGSNTLTQTSLIVINDSPTAGFTPSISGLIATFANSSTGATSYSWDFGDGNMSTMANPSHTYTSGGSYTVVLTATNACGSQQFTQVISVGGAPSAAFTSTTANGCSPLSITFSDMSSGAPSSWSWSFPGGTPSNSTLQNPTIVYSNPGTYDVTLSATNAIGSNSSMQMSYVVVGDVPIAGFMTSTTGYTVSMNNTSVGGTTYSWTFGDGNSSVDPSPMHTYTDAGTYTIELTATNTCGSQQSTETITIGVAPTAAFGLTNSNGCAPLTVNFSDQSLGIASSWNWSFPGGTPATSTAANPVVVYNTAGTYDVTLTATNGLGNDVSNQAGAVVVNDIPLSGFNSSLSGTTATFVNTSTNATSYSWDFGDGNMSTLANPTNMYTNPGTYTVVLTATNACGSQQFTEVVNIVSMAAPIPGIAVDVASGCIPLTVVYTDQSSGNPTSWNWTFAGGTPASSAQQNPTVVYNTSGSHDVSLTVTNSFGMNSSTFSNYIVATDVPVTSFIHAVSGGQVDFTNTTFSGLSYSWDFGDGSSSTQASPIHTYAASGTYTVILTATNSCGTTTSTETVVINLSTSVDDLLGLIGIAVTPNPNSGIFELELSGESIAEVSIQIYDLIGQRVYQNQVSLLSGRVVLPIELMDVATGTYVLVIGVDGKVGSRKIFVGK